MYVYMYMYIKFRTVYTLSTVSDTAGHRQLGVRPWPSRTGRDKYVYMYTRTQIYICVHIYIHKYIHFMYVHRYKYVQLVSSGRNMEHGVRHCRTPAVGRATLAVAHWASCLLAGPLSSEYGTRQTVKTKLWPGLAGERPGHISDWSLFARKWRGASWAGRYIHKDIHIYIYIYLYSYMYIFTYIYESIFITNKTNIHIYTHMYINIHICTLAVARWASCLDVGRVSFIAAPAACFGGARRAVRGRSIRPGLSSSLRACIKHWSTFGIVNF